MLKSRMAVSIVDKLGVPSEYLTDDFESAILRDLRFVLNSSLSQICELEEFPHASASLLTIGVSNFGGVPIGSRRDAERKVGSAIKEAIMRFEPRLTNISVTPRSGDLLSFDVNARIACGTGLHSEVSLTATLETAVNDDPGLQRSGRLRLDED
jgi:predicted component of type VI protein secretion system